MGEWNPYRLNDFEWEVLQLYIKYGYGDAKLYNTTFFSCNMTDETVCLTLEEFAEKAVDWEDLRWMDKTDNACIDELLKGEEG